MQCQNQSARDMLIDEINARLVRASGTTCFIDPRDLREWLRSKLTGSSGYHTGIFEEVYELFRNSGWDVRWVDAGDRAEWWVIEVRPS